MKLVTRKEINLFKFLMSQLKENDFNVKAIDGFDIREELLLDEGSGYEYKVKFNIKTKELKQSEE